MRTPPIFISAATFKKALAREEGAEDHFTWLTLLNELTYKSSCASSACA